MSVATRECTRTKSYATLRVRHLDGGASWMLELSGEADIATVGLLGQELAHAATMQRADVVVDLSGLGFCDVASAELILSARRSHLVTLIGATGSVKRVFDLLDALQVRRVPGFLAVGHTRVRP